MNDDFPNAAQKKVLLYTAIAVVAMLAFPPWYVRRSSAVFGVGYSFLFEPPREGAVVDGRMLLLQWLCALIVGGIALVMAKNPTPPPEKG